MMKKCFGVFAALALLVSLTVPGLAYTGYGDGDALNYITDAAGILSGEELDALEAKAAEIAARYPCEVYAVIVEDYADYGGSPEEACDNIYGTYDLGSGVGGDAIVLLLSMDDRDFWLEDYGDYSEYAMTDYGGDILEEAMLDNFGDDDWYGGLSGYLEQSAVILETARTGEPLDYPPLTMGERLVFSYGPALLVGLLIALIVCSVFKAQMKTAVEATSAEEYVAPSGVSMYIREDRYSHTTRTQRKIEKPKSSSRDSGRGGKF